MGKDTVLAEGAPAIDDVVARFVLACLRLLAEADSRLHNPVDGVGVLVEREDAFRLAVAEAMLACDLLRRTGARSFVITEKGIAAYAKVEQNRKTHRDNICR